MCTWGDTVVLEHFGRRFGVDRCIAGLVDALNAGGQRTIASCCGHGHRPGRITLADGRELAVAADRVMMEHLERGYPDIHGNPVREVL